jgi:hypothetical protein
MFYAVKTKDLRGWDAVSARKDPVRMFAFCSLLLPGTAPGCNHGVAETICFSRLYLDRGIGLSGAWACARGRTRARQGHEPRALCVLSLSYPLTSAHPNRGRLRGVWLDRSRSWTQN